jgi:hypothetical protein
MMKAGYREGFQKGRQGVWLITIPSPWSERAPLCWRVPLPDGRDFCHAAIVPALEYLQTWMIMHSSLHDIVMSMLHRTTRESFPATWRKWVFRYGWL